MIRILGYESVDGQGRRYVCGLLENMYRGRQNIRNKMSGRLLQIQRFELIKRL